MKKKIIAAVCVAAMVIPSICARADYKESDLKTALTDAINWKNDNDNPFYSIGSDGSNLYVTALKRLGMNFDYGTYLSGLDGTAAGFGPEHKASDMQRTVLAVKACGGDVQNVGGRDLLADSTYFRDNEAPLDREGSDGYSWALITLDSGDYALPDWALRNRNTIISGMLSHQNTDGSFDGSVYSTAAAITALARYRETSGAYTVTQNQTGYEIEISPKDAVDNALGYLSDTQEVDGDWGDLTSTAMAVIALDTVGIDCDGDSRFEARKGTALEGLMSYKNKDGGFSYNSNKSSGDATSYAICAMESHLRKLQGKSALFYLASDDTVSLNVATPTPKSTTAPARTTSPSSSTSSSSSSTSSSSSSTASRATARPSATASASKPANTMIPTRTTTPRSSDQPAFTPRTLVTPTPKPTKRPALVGPVEMPGPLPPTDSPETDSARGHSDRSDTSKGAVPIAIGIGVLVLLAACAAAAAIVLKNKGKLPDNGIFAAFNPTANGAKKAENKKAVTHTRGEQHRDYENRRKFEQREKYKKRRKYR